MVPVPNQYSLTWDSYESSICKGFSSLQQSGEFVDMTLAADGHLVKVHQVIMALASPYLKELICSVPSQHPIIFLSNVPHATLALLLEYIYTGEVMVPTIHLQSFMEAAKSLHVRGLENINSDFYSKISQATDTTGTTGTMVSHTEVKRGIPLNIQSVQTATYDLPRTARKISIKPEQITKVINMKDDVQEFSDKNEYPSYDECVMDVSMDHATDDDDADTQTPQASTNETHKTHKTEVNGDNILIDSMEGPNAEAIKDKVSSNSIQFTVSIRGYLQVILNRYMYNLNYSGNQSGVKRWRCIDYRNKKCPATLVTKGNVVLSRHCLHNHSFHDKKILGKIQSNSVYSALDEVECLKEKESRKSLESDWPADAPIIECDSEK